MSVYHAWLCIFKHGFMDWLSLVVNHKCQCIMHDDVYLSMVWWIELDLLLTHWSRDKMEAISQTTFSSAFFLNENILIPIKISLKFVPKGSFNNIPALVQIMAWRRPGDKPLSESMMVDLPTHICVTRPQWILITTKCPHICVTSRCIFPFLITKNEARQTDKC